MSSDRTPPDFSAPPQQWSLFPEILAKLARLLAEAPKIHAPLGGDAISEELIRALKSGQIRYEFILGNVLLPPALAGLPRDPTDGRVLLPGELWKFVDPHSGEFKHPYDAVSRWIKVCEEDALAHFRGWLRQEQLPETDETDKPADRDTKTKAFSPAMKKAIDEYRRDHPGAGERTTREYLAGKHMHPPRQSVRDYLMGRM